MATTEHRVATHLGLAASDYDAQIRRYTPRYDEMIDTVIAIIAGLERGETAGGDPDGLAGEAGGRAPRGIDAPYGIAPTEARALLAQWAGEDRYYPLAAELAMLGAAGFAQPECFWKDGPATVFGGFR
jgi:hypothetical protein